MKVTIPIHYKDTKNAQETQRVDPKLCEAFASFCAFAVKEISGNVVSARFLKRFLALLVIAGFGVLVMLNKSAAFQSPTEKWRLGKSVNKSRFVGSAVCAQCHEEIAAKQSKTAMALALTSTADDELLKQRAPLTFKLGEFTYRIERTGTQFSYNITNSKDRFSTPLLWSFGHGTSGKTFVIQHNGTFYETRVSYFTSLARLDLTPGAPRELPTSLESAIGQPQRANEALGCFTCHSTPLPATTEIKLDQFTQGLQCEVCHGPGENHLAALKSGKKELAKQEIFNPRSWPADDVNQLMCGACHRSWEAVMQLPERGGDANVRFQPYRLANSKCYQNPDDRRIGCTACHDPHGDVAHEARAYDAKCLACHQGGTTSVKADAQRTAPACRTGKQNCVSCHMPKYEPSHLHFKFTDHWIRVVKPGDPHPR